MSAYNSSGQPNLTETNGSTYTGRYAPDGSMYIVINDGSSYTGFHHRCGAVNAVITTDTSTWAAPNGSMYVISTVDGYHPVNPGNPVTFTPGGSGFYYAWIFI